MVLDLGRLGVFCGRPQHDRRLASSIIQKDKRGGGIDLITPLKIKLKRQKVKGHSATASSMSAALLLEMLDQVAIT